MVSQTTSRVPIKLAQVWIVRKNQKTSGIVLSTKVHVLKVWKQTTTVTTFENLVTLSTPHDTTTPPSSNTTIVHIQCQVALVVSMVSCYIFSLSCLHISDVFFCFYLSLPPFHGTFSHPPRLTPSPDSSTTQKCVHIFVLYLCSSHAFSPICWHLVFLYFLLSLNPSFSSPSACPSEIFLELVANYF